MSSASRSELITHIQGELGVTRAEARTALEAVLGGVIAHLRTDQKVAFSGFGTFEAYERGPLRRYDMNSGVTRTLPARYRVKFTPSPKLLETIRENADV